MTAESFDRLRKSGETARRAKRCMTGLGTSRFTGFGDNLKTGSGCHNGLSTLPVCPHPNPLPEGEGTLGMVLIIDGRDVSCGLARGKCQGIWELKFETVELGIGDRGLGGEVPRMGGTEGVTQKLSHNNPGLSSVTVQTW